MRSTIGMKVRAYEKTDLEEINSWYNKRKLPLVNAEIMPKTGFIVPGVAVAFMYKTDSEIALLDGCISNPDAAPYERKEALEIIMNELVCEAAHQGFNKVIAMTRHPSIKEVCKRANLRDIGEYTMFSKEL